MRDSAVPADEVLACARLEASVVLARLATPAGGLAEGEAQKRLNEGYVPS